MNLVVAILLRHAIASVPCRILLVKVLVQPFHILPPYFVSGELRIPGLSLDRLKIRNMPIADMPAAW
jgi:hypothetical protein